MGFLSLTALAALSWILGSLIGKRLENLVHTVEDFELGKDPPPIATSDTDEVGRLATSFHQVFDQANSQYKERLKLEETRQTTATGAMT